MPTYNNQATFVKLEKTKRAGHAYVGVVHTPQTGPLAGQEITVGNFVSNLNSEIIDTMKSLTEGETVTLHVEQPDGTKFRNLTGVTRGIVKAARKPSSFTKTTNTDYNDRAAKGQALNLAMQVAISEGKAHDDNYILSLIPRMIKLGEGVQNGFGIKLQGTKSTMETNTATTPAQKITQTPAVSKSSTTTTAMGTSELEDDDFQGLFDGEL